MTEAIRFRRIDPNTGTTPFLKWAGGKRWLVRMGIAVPELGSNGTYFEPFLGAGSLFFALQPSKAVLGDLNHHLIRCYRGLRARPARVIRELSAMPHDRDTFEHVKSWSPTIQEQVAVRFIYLNRTAFGGIYRENQLGEFNVPYGNDNTRTVCQEPQLRAAAKQLASAQLRVGSFDTTASAAKSGDFVYLDPPYIQGHRDNGFVRYNKHLFTWDNQIQLADLACELAGRGVHVLISNAPHKDVLSLYKDFNIVTVERNSQISRDASRRGVSSEALISTYPNPIPST